ncbi:MULTISPECIES: HD domain-containing phosphohydrolase [unclassified Fusibacter]|uniref:HD domain-containing phosphohydrolase n=1 Tax=unclassified Fusibacter TaxID=2624464 RepID=UPI001011ADE2|nr:MULTISPECIES: HD domain-containing phosphohydrolase [unclassified Fusibacter]MCK8059913.1 DUF3369 domain-containing protein [Fusibacter sp. A2]NPE22055.1 DUF3369 domain-containing protein [Fusibacter sp. A1]RXV60835.1 DUF3369 domain-containing protein [Fusibacter sp. A1]
MGYKNENEDFTLDFLIDDVEDVGNKPVKKPYKIIIADDDQEVHMITKMILKEFEFEGSKLEFFDTYSGKETIELIKRESDIAIVFLDVVMESHHSGLEVVTYMRDVLKNTMTRIVLRTGQPGEAPEEDVIKQYDINDYRLKTELTVKRLHTTLYTALRNYRDLRQLSDHKKGLERIIKTSSQLFSHASLNDFLTSVLDELSNFYQEPSGMVYLREDHTDHSINSGFVTIDNRNKTKIVAATGKYKEYIGKDIEDVPELSFIDPKVLNETPFENPISQVEKGFVVKNRGRSMINNYVYIEGERKQYDFELINLFLLNYSSALDNYLMSTILSSARKDIIRAVISAVENHYTDPDSHIKRTSCMMSKFAIACGYSQSEAEVLRVSSSLHDIGKLEIPKTILWKTEPLSEGEIEIVEHHTKAGYDILEHSDLDLLRIAAEMALNHHEKFDGTGYPEGKKGEAIPKTARMLSIVDVYDAITHDRTYGDIYNEIDALELIKSEAGKKFDPELVKIFVDHYDEIMSFEK